MKITLKHISDRIFNFQTKIPILVVLIRIFRNIKNYDFFHKLLLYMESAQGKLSNELSHDYISSCFRNSPQGAIGRLMF